MELTKLKVGESARVSQILTDNDAKTRFAELGLVEGVEVLIVRFAPLGDPLEIKVRDVYLAIRVSDAKKIMVEKA
ncbi:MAG: ferrous iron transport protein A [Clostridia bacterium]|nr:ferrous iron transport protein A [Clostridia bacterium]